MRALRDLGFLSLLMLGASAAGQGIVASPMPDSVDVTVYRDPGRPADRDPDLQWLNGFALVSETRRVAIPAGESNIRFEGVAGGILPQSAIVTGLPEGIVERNRDAYLLSPATLLDRSLGRRVHLRRTSRATGAVREQEAIVRSGAAGAVMLETESGIETLRCTGLNETPVYESIPAELSVRPTLSVRARSARPVTATVTLSYLASGFDWQADYVASLSEDGSRIDLFAWLTLASTDETSFVAADTQAVAGRLNRTDVRVPPSEGPPLNLQCWPQGTTSDIPEEAFDREDIVVTGSRIPVDAAYAMAPPPPPPPAPAARAVMQAQQEELGDLKLYRIPEPVTVAARSQKQVALLQRGGVQVRTVYRQSLSLHDSNRAGAARRTLVTRNRTQEGLGLPLPAGRIRLFADRGARPILIGQGTLADRAVGEDVEIDLGEAPGVRTESVLTLRKAGGRAMRDYVVTVTNDLAAPIAFEAEVMADGAEVESRTRLGRRNGRPLWTVQVPANGSAELRFSAPRP
ncbi:hypothetical protein RCO27_10690 [Sphingosinicella sp. LHD-64]|uniref:DUF4139 domain-containing protein n=1 Tax=Sphingosinicella sp. LHD-64 TaxID=3072139 RepID=UPI00280F48C1|nr:hypothetical protein [Sphingosinicella sp. LHD-64]MDQ8756695.1 hypothetical protein [Sphingosinicella sp. LHD-64]